VVEGIKKYKVSEKNRVAAIGDGGNDVGMIQAADIGLGIAGK
jgi:phospholipid-translocating ATPase